MCRVISQWDTTDGGAQTSNQTDWLVHACAWMSWRLARIKAEQPNGKMPP